MKLKITLLAFCMSYALLIQAQDKKKWDVSNPPGEYKEIEVIADEGTWMNLDVSPDGRTIVFDMMGDIYKMPISGGSAQVLRSGLPYEVQPRFSPDGKQILFTSDAGGGDNLWVMDSNGKNAKQITKENFRLLNNGIWTPDGEYFIARKHFTSGRSLGAGELWMYHKTGGSGIQLTKRKNDQQDLNEPSISKDGRYVYYSEDMYPGGNFQYNKNPNSQITVVKRYDRETGKTENVAGGPGGACRPQVSNSGRYLAFVRRVRTKSVLYLQDLETGEEWPIFDGLAKDQMEAWTVFGVYTGFSWTPNDKNIVIWGKEGRIWNVDVDKKRGQLVKFSVTAKHKIAEAVRFEQQVHSDEFEAKAIRQAVTSPDGKLLIFNAAGFLWKKKLPNGTPERLLPKMDDLQFEPDFSPKGDEVVFVTWSDVEKGAIYKVSTTARKPIAVRLTTKKGIYRTPRFSPDGQMIVYNKTRGNNHQGHSFTKDKGIYTMSSDGKNALLVTKNGDNPRFDKTGKRIFLQNGGYLFGSLKKGYKSVKLNGTDEKKILKTKYSTQFVPSPDNKWVAFIDLFKVYIAPMPQTGQAFGLSPETKAVPVALVSKDAGINLHWSGDSKMLHWTLGDEYFSTTLRERFLFLENSVDSLPPLADKGLKIGLKLESDKPKGTIVLKGARIITMNGDKVIENGTIVIKENKITAIGASDEVKTPFRANVIDVSGKTIMPGIIDVHAHVGNFRYGLSPQQQWEYFANLAYGVTTVHDPSSNTEMIFSQAEMIKSGSMVGPRMYSTGVILYGAEGDFKATINTLEDAKSALRRTKAFGAFSVKSYNQPRREQRQMVIQAARELEMQVVPEGGSFFFHNMSMILDGHTGIEHNIPVAPLYRDVIDVWKNSNTGYTPTLIVNYGSVNGEYYWYQNTNVWEKDRLLSFTPRSIVDSRSRHRMMLPDEEYQNGHILTSKSCKKLADAGVKVNLGAHGQLQGLGAHWELWMLAQGGITNMEALRSATLNGAHYLSMDKEIGSLEVGKLADLIVLDKNPLENIRNTETVIYTMVNGRLYDSATMNETGNTSKKRLPFFWEINKYSNSFDWHEATNSFMRPKCGCGAH
jgi:imidazolonepropionase-like amidohydrolase/Tol biopolymer transport system component